MECTRSELDYSAPKFEQNEIESDYFIYLTPKNTIIEGSPILFEIQENSDFLDLSQTTLTVKIQLVEGDNSEILPTSLVCPVNNTLHSLFSQLTISLKDSVISQPNNLYPYRAYIENLLNYSKAVKDSWLRAEGWSTDQVNRFDNPNNSALTIRREPLLRGGIQELSGRLHGDIFFQSRLIPSNLDVKIVLTPTDPKFSVMYFGTGTKSFKLKIIDAALSVRKVKLTQAKNLAFERQIAAAPINLPLNYVHMKTSVLAQGIASHNHNSLYSGVLPNRIILAFLDNESFTGKFNKNPFNLKHYNLSLINLSVNGKSIPSQPIEPDFASGHVLGAYNSLFSTLGVRFDNWENGLTVDDYIHGSTLFGFNLTSHDCSSGNSHRTGSVDLNIRFSDALTSTVSIIFYAEYSNNIIIDRFRNVITDISN